MPKYLMPEITDQWVSVFALLGVSVGTKVSISVAEVQAMYFLLQNTTPNPTEIGFPLDNALLSHNNTIVLQEGVGDVWLRCPDGKKSRVLLQAGEGISFSDNGTPFGLFEGLRAITIQDYNECNKKNGTQWSASRRISAATQNTHNLSIIKTGAKPVDLKRREFAFSGEGLVADVFANPVYTGGIQDPVYSANGITPSSFDFQLLRSFTITGGAGSGETFPANYGTKFAPTVYAIGPKSTVSKGLPAALYGSNYILAPNTSYLLVFYSIDANAQDIAARIEGYNGFLDLPRPIIV